MNTTLLETGDNSWCHFRSMEREKGGRDRRGSRSLGELGERGRGERSTDGRIKKTSVHILI